MIGVVVMTDGRIDCLRRSVASLRAQVDVDAHMMIHDDTGDDDYRWELQDEFTDFEVLGVGQRRGFSGAYAFMWRVLAERRFVWVFSTEDDFTFNEPIPIMDMAEVLNADPAVAQMALKRQPWSPEEKVAGGFMAMHPEDYHDEVTDGHRWCWQRRFFTTNPSLYHGLLTERGWPSEDQSEGKFGLRLLQDRPETKFGFWGHRDDPPLVHHIGDERVGTGY